MKTMATRSRWFPARWAADDTSDCVDLHRSKGPTPRTAGTTDFHHAAKLINSFPRCTRTAAGASFKRGQPFGFRIAACTA
jgi:hypothetical protein